SYPTRRSSDLYTEYPIHTASGIWMNTGSTLDGYVINKFATTQEKTAFTISTKIKIMNKNNIFARCPDNLSPKVPIACPLFRTDSTMVPKSCTPAAKMVPKTTHKNAGSQPQYTAIAGPSIGAAPATEVK